MTQPTEPHNPLDEDAELQQRLAESRREWGTYVASTRIYVGNALAADIGHPVPISNVVKHGYWFNGQVSLVDGAEHAPEIQAGIAASQPAPDEALARAVDPGTDEDGGN